MTRKFSVKIEMLVVFDLARWVRPISELETEQNDSKNVSGCLKQLKKKWFYKILKAVPGKQGNICILSNALSLKCYHLLSNFNCVSIMEQSSHPPKETF